jgi:6-phosphogluconolactonase
MALEIITCASRELAAETVAQMASRALHAALDASGRASLFVSGGSTPKRTFEVLSGASLDWDAVTVGLVDERWVPPEHPESNERLVRTHLLTGRAGAAGFLPMWTSAGDYKLAADERDNAYAPHCTAASFVLLGMGVDAHIASWFPEAPLLASVVSPPEGRCVMAVEAKGAVTPQRLTLTGPVILRAKSAVLLVFGQEKRDVLEAAIHADPVKCPVRFAIDGLGDRLSIVWAP